MIARTTFLTRGQVIDMSMTALQRATTNFTTPSLVLGHLCEYTHTELLIQHGFPVVESAQYAAYDREIFGMWQDDKVATFETRDNKLSDTHNITPAEHDAWERRLRAGIDTAIQSFEYVDDTYQQAIYRGTISFRLLYNAPNGAGIRAGEENYYFSRKSALQFNLLHG